MRDLSQLEAEIIEIRRQLNWMLSGAFLENASVDRGGLQVRAEEGFIIGEEGSSSGSGRVYGTLWISGVLDGDGQFNWSGSWRFDSGDGEISGDVNLSGNFNLTGVFTSGNVRIEDGKVYVGEGANLIVIDGETGTLSVGDLVLDPSDHDGMIALPNGGQILGEGGEVAIYSPPGGGGIRNGLVVTSTGVRMDFLPTATSDDLPLLDWVARHVITGELYRVPAGVGGPMGQLAWPFPESTVSSEYGPRESPGPGGSTFHEGMDFTPGEGVDIPASGSGTVELAGTNGGFGNCVIINHGNGIKTLYGHMQSAPTVSVGQMVARGQIIGQVGNTGVSFGAHLHFEVHVDGVPVNPRSKLQAP